MLEFFKDPQVISLGITMLGVILVKLIWPLLERAVKKTPTMADDQFLDAIEGIVNGAIAKKGLGEIPNAIPTSVVKK
jgi:hypothetical protein